MLEVAIGDDGEINCDDDELGVEFLDNDADIMMGVFLNASESDCDGDDEMMKVEYNTLRLTHPHLISLMVILTQSDFEPCQKIIL